MSRLERILSKLAQRHAPHLLARRQHITANPVARVQALARKLARYGVLVLVGQVDDALAPHRQLVVEDWVQAYARFYASLAVPLLPSYAQLEAREADAEVPPIIVLLGQAAPVIDVCAGLVNPYLAQRGPEGGITDLELGGLMDEVLVDLDVDNLPPAARRDLRENGRLALRRLVNAPITLISLTTFDRPILPPAPRMPPATLPETPAAKPQVAPAPDPAPMDYELEQLPDDPDAPPTPTEQLFTRELPLLRSASDRLPPVPRLKDEDDMEPRNSE